MQTTLCIMEIQEGREKGAERKFEAILAKNLTNIRKEINIHIQEVKNIPTSIHNEIYCNQAVKNQKQGEKV